MKQIMYSGDRVEIEQDECYGVIKHLDKKIDLKFSLDWNELLEQYRIAIENDSNGKYHDDNFKEIMEEIIERGK